MNTVSHITDSLNSAQHEAVTAPLQHMLVLAGAGSGKTRVLVHRIAYLMTVHQVSPREILAVTFTNKAANEMRGRIEALHNIPIHHMWVGTFHGLAHRLLRSHFVEARLPQTFQIIDSDDQLRLIKRIQRTLNIDESLFEPKKSQWFINHHKENGHRAAHLAQQELDYLSEVLTRIYAEYEAVCERSGIVDFAELLLRSFELLDKNESVQSHYQQRFSHILVDEFQDTNTIQYRWLRALAGKNSFMMAVGDDDQSIYSWRGAQVQNIRHFSKDFSHAQTIRLEQNYRSTKIILDAANAVIAKNKTRMGKTLWTSEKGGDAITLFEAFHEREEASYVIAEIKQLIRDQYQLENIAILYRSNAQSRVLEEALLEAAIPYRIYGGFRFFERAEIKDVLAYLRLLVNRSDDAAFERIINTPTRGLGQTTVSIIREMANRNHASLWETAQQCLDTACFSARAHAALSGFLALINLLDKEVKHLKLASCVDVVLLRSGLLTASMQDKSEKGLSRTENLRELITATVEFAVKSEQRDLSEIEAFLADIALETGEQQADAQTNCVSLMTLHAAKGLEFPVVFMVGLEECLFPHQMSMNERGGLEEERRLCYVGMTRAMKHLYLSCAEHRHLHGQSHHHPPSRFISEIPEQLMHRVRPKVSSAKASAYAAENAGYFSSSRTKKMTTSVSHKKLNHTDSGFSIGQHVTHAKFGLGIILDVEGSGDATRVQVRFEKQGTKWLVLQFAGLVA